MTMNAMKETAVNGSGHVVARTIARRLAAVGIAAASALYGGGAVAAETYFNLLGRNNVGPCPAGFDWVYQYQLGMPNRYARSGHKSNFVTSGVRVHVHKDMFQYGGGHILVIPVAQHYNGGWCVSSSRRAIHKYGYGCAYTLEQGLGFFETWTGGTYGRPSGYYTCPGSGYCRNTSITQRRLDRLPGWTSNSWYTLACEVRRVGTNQLKTTGWVSYKGKENTEWLSYGSTHVPDNHMINYTTIQQMTGMAKNHNFYYRSKWNTGYTYFQSR